MCVMNFSMGMNYRHISENNKIIIGKFNELKCSGNDFITISYLIKNVDMNLNEIHSSIYELLEFNIIEVIEFSRCPYCLNDNKIKNTVDICRCNRCKKIYDEEYIIEKFRLLSEELDENRNEK
ncbi:hypothetical protein HYH96_04615 [Clostridium botulinum]|uniref:hypothetical protein n=1 Tax=Clostridium botulinum TaxID=1491 RepID=UPI00174DA064|nr:hypothetical protein [Clostridium botulinum]MBD5643175.1 hypothetical protein [Clostridium botulinum]